MEKATCYPERISKFGLGMIFLLLAATFFILGFTALPILGILIAAPFAGGSVYFFRAHLDKNCQLVQ